MHERDAEEGLRALAARGEPFIAVGDDGDGHVVIAVGMEPGRADALARTRGLSVARVEHDDVERLALAFFGGRGAEEREPVLVVALAPAVPEEAAHLATLARAEEVSLVVIDVPGGARRAVRAIEPGALDELRELAREAGIEGA